MVGKVPVFSSSAIKAVKVDTKVRVKDLSRDQAMFEFSHLISGHMQNKDASGINMGHPKKLQRRLLLLTHKIYSSFDPKFV